MDWDGKMPSRDLGTVVGPSESGSGAPTKRPPAVQEKQAVPECLVEGCAADLSKRYHQRHNVCEAHSKTPVVSVASQRQRSCRLCSKFHLLKDFDGVNRLCRSRMYHHNERRWKAQPDPLSHGSLFASHHGYSHTGRSCSSSFPFFAPKGGVLTATIGTSGASGGSTSHRPRPSVLGAVEHLSPRSIKAKPTDRELGELEREGSRGST